MSSIDDGEHVTKQMLFIPLVMLFAGCANDRAMTSRVPNEDIPSSAVAATEGNGRLWFQATDDGVLYLYDAETTELLFTAPMNKNQRLVLDTQAQRDR